MNLIQVVAIDNDSTRECILLYLRKNPNPNDKSTAYLPFVKPHTAKITLYDKEVLEGWRFDKEDMPVIRHRIKKYKKSYNRKPPMWYEKKKQKKK